MNKFVYLAVPSRWESKSAAFPSPLWAMTPAFGSKHEPFFQKCDR